METVQDNITEKQNNVLSSTFELNIERYSDEEGRLEPFNSTIKWVEFGGSTTVFEALTYAAKTGLAYLSAFYGYSTGWSVSNFGGWGPGENYHWEIYIDGVQRSANQGLDQISIARKANNKTVTLKRVQNS